MATLPFLNRAEELARLDRALRDDAHALVVVYGRRRLGKSRLVLEALRERSGTYYVGDDRDAALQREDLARQITARVPGFGQVTYPDWSALLERWWRDAPGGDVLALDEFPSLVRSSPELPSLVQKLLDRPSRPPRGLILDGSSQRMMHGLVLDGSAPLYGRAREILKLGPLDISWIRRALGLRSDAAAVDHWSVWGGVPRYWELARDHRSREDALRSLVLDPLGVLHREPARLLADELDVSTRAATILSFVGRGVQRTSELAARVGVPATSLSRAVALLVELGLLERESRSGTPRGTPSAAATASPIRSCARGSGSWSPTAHAWRAGSSDRWRRTSRSAGPRTSARPGRISVGPAWRRLELFGRRWRPASHWWGPGTDRRPLEIDILARADDDPNVMLCGEAKVSAGSRDVARILEELAQKAARVPDLAGKRILCAAWVLRPRGRVPASGVVSARDVVSSEA